MHCCTCSKYIHLRCLLLSFPRFKTLGSSYSWSSPPCCVPASFKSHTPTNTGSSSYGSSSLHTSTVQPSPSGSFSQCPTLVIKPPTLLPPTLYLLSLHLPHPFMFLDIFLYFLLPLPPQIRLEFFNGMQEVFVPGALNYYTLPRLNLWILSVFRNPIFTHLFHFGSLGSLLCDLIALTPGLAFFLQITRTLVLASLFLSDRAYPSLSSPLSLSLRFTSTLIT